MPTCPNGHATTATDYCDTCGAPVDAAAAEPAPAAPAADASAVAGEPAATAAKVCPTCHGVNPPNALFCEACGYDFTTGSLPRPSTFDLDAPAPAPAPVEFDLDAPVPAPALPEEPVEADVVSVSGPEGAPGASSSWAPAPALPDEPVDADVIEEAPAIPVPVAPAIPVPAAPAIPVPAAPEAVPAPVAPAPQPVAPEQPTGPAEWVAEVWIDPDWYAGQDSPDQLPSPGLPRIVGLRKRASLIGRPSRSRGITPDIDAEPDTGVSRRHAELTTDGSRWWVEDLGSANGTYVGLAGAPLPEQPIGGRTELGADARVYVGSWTRIVVRRADADEADL